VFLNIVPTLDDALNVETRWDVCKILECWILAHVYELVVLNIPYDVSTV
jgi:hypothetical protein